MFLNIYLFFKMGGGGGGGDFFSDLENILSLSLSL